VFSCNYLLQTISFIEPKNLKVRSQYSKMQVRGRMISVGHFYITLPGMHPKPTGKTTWKKIKIYILNTILQPDTRRI
jgi:hypothetical protein